MELSARLNAKGRIRARIRTRMYYSQQHIQSAALFTRQSYQIESDYNGTPLNELIVEHRSYVTGAIFAAVSFLESTINELFSDTVDHPDGDLASHLDSSTKLLMADMWKLRIPKTATYPIIDKYQIALTLARKALFDTEQALWKDVKTLIVLRNALIHYEPVWTSQKEEGQAYKGILSLKQQKKFALNPLITEQFNPFFPDKCLSHGCARWAVNTSVQFVQEFFSKMGIPVLFDHIKPLLKTEP